MSAFWETTIDDVLVVLRQHDADTNHIEEDFDGLDFDAIEKGVSHYTDLSDQTASMMSDIEDQLMKSGRIPKGRKKFNNPVAKVERRLTPLEEINGMTEDQLESKRANMESYFDSCREIGQGIGTKESVWYRRVCDRLEQEFGHTIERWH